jgi:uncharacterized lipoprotein YddW (UPF0748 family)
LLRQRLLLVSLSAVTISLVVASPACAEITGYRSMFVDRFDFPYQNGDVASMTATVEDMIDRAADEGFTEVIWQVRARGDALYNSNVEPAASGLTLGFDPLQVAIDASHARGLKLHAWLNSTPMWSGTTETPPAGHIFHNTNPSFRVQHLDGTLEPQQGYSNYASANPILPEMHAHLNNVVTDIATNYNVDGIHLDYIRYLPGTLNANNFARMPHDAISHQMFQNATGLDGSDVANFAAYKTFLTGRITDLVASIKQNVDALEASEGRPMELTASVFMTPSRAKNEYGQDWGTWVEQGLLDVAMPMLYLSAQNDELFEPYLAEALSHQSASTPTRVAPTLASYLHMNPTRGGGVALTMEQMQITHAHGADGIGFYDYPAYFNAYSESDRQEIRDLFDSLIPPPPANIIDDFEADEGHFAWPYNLSPLSQTNGLTASTTIERVTTEAQDGDASQELSLVATSEGGPWNLRHNSGIGAGMNSRPEGNVALEPTGFVGFWLKTDDAGVTVQLGIDDPVPSGATAIEKGIAQTVLADGQWHLYEWDLADEADWVAFGNAGSDGDIDATAGTVTIDSIFLSGAGNVQLFLDTVSHNPNGSLATSPPPMPGDFNGDGTVDDADLTAWSNGFGKATDATAEDGDGDDDGDVDGSDFLVWQQNVGMTNVAAAPTAAAVPEPSAIALMALAPFLVLFRRGPRVR